LWVASFPKEEEKQPEDDPIFHSLIVSGEKLTPRNRWATVGSLAFELLFLLALVAIPFFHTDPLPKRERLTMLYLQPPPAAGGNAAKLLPSKPTSTYTPPTTAILASVHTKQKAPPPPVDTTSEVVAGVPGGVVGGLPGGVGGVVGEMPGVPGGVSSEVSGAASSMPILATAPEPTPVKRIRIASRVAEANLIHDVSPQYPPEAGQERIEGTVVLLAVIGKDGSVQDVQVVSGLPLLAQAAVEAVKQWRYKPYLLNGEPVEIDSRITINFTLSRG